jgi:hypothetical protein
MEHVEAGSRWSRQAIRFAGLSLAASAAVSALNAATDTETSWTISPGYTDTRTYPVSVAYRPPLEERRETTIHQPQTEPLIYSLHTADSGDFEAALPTTTAKLNIFMDTVAERVQAGGSVQYIDITGYTSDEVRGPNAGLGVRDKGNKQLGLGRAKVGGNVLHAVAQSRDLALPKIAYSSYEKLLDTDQVNAVHAMAERYGYPDADAFVQAYKKGAEVSTEDAVNLSEWLDNNRGFEVVIGVGQTVPVTVKEDVCVQNVTHAYAQETTDRRFPLTFVPLYWRRRRTKNSSVDQGNEPQAGPITTDHSANETSASQMRSGDDLSTSAVEQKPRRLRKLAGSLLLAGVALSTVDPSFGYCPEHETLPSPGWKAELNHPSRINFDLRIPFTDARADTPAYIKLASCPPAPKIQQTSEAACTPQETTHQKAVNNSVERTLTTSQQIPLP